MTQPRVIMIAGPNGAGKTTFAREFLPREASCPVFVNADLIAAGLSPFEPDKAAIQAGRLMLNAIADHAARRESFAFETTLSGIAYARHIPVWRERGYGVKLFFLSLPTAEAAIARVAERVRHGGHDIPEAVVRRRFIAGRRLFETLYKPIVDEWVLCDNAGHAPILLDRSTKIMSTAKSVKEPLAAYGGLPDDADADLKGAYAALLRAAKRAEEIARQTGTDLIRVKDGRVVRVKPDAARDEP